MDEPRPTTISARPCERRSRVANSWNTRTGSAALSTVTALVRRIRFVREAAGALDLLDHVSQPLRCVLGPAGFVERRGETVDANLHRDPFLHLAEFDLADVDRDHQRLQCRTPVRLASVNQVLCRHYDSREFLELRNVMRCGSTS